MNSLVGENAPPGFKPLLSPEVNAAPYLTPLLRASDWIPGIFGNQTDQYRFEWSQPVDESSSKSVKLSAQGSQAGASMLLRVDDLDDWLQVKRKLLELRGDLLIQETDQSLVRVREAIESALRQDLASVEVSSVTEEE